ncbi:hypothetical protein V1478_016586 [Vespula squamosa]|uniref:Uncharacterized protein n=1 Tax=Vespula squamosa TaxID=30214 RepID=A0ABD2A076_VESSQ
MINIVNYIRYFEYCITINIRLFFYRNRCKYKNIDSICTYFNIILLFAHIKSGFFLNGVSKVQIGDHKSSTFKISKMYTLRIQNSDFNVKCTHIKASYNISDIRLYFDTNFFESNI